MKPHLWRRLCAVSAALAVGGLAAAAVALPAAAHVTVRAESTAAGSFSALTFRVPNESDTAGTTKLVVTLPADQPFLYVSTKPVPGWSVATTEAKLAKPVESYGTTITKAVRTVTWTATGSTRIEPGQYQDFSISAGPLPASGTISIPASQTYSDGTVVDWNEAADGSAEPEHPAPVFTVQAQEAVPTTAPVEAATASAATSDPVARLLSGLALAVGVLACVLTMLGRRSRATT